jgi:internalin A
MLVQILGKSYNVNTKELILSHNQLTTLPESIGNLVNLQYLNLCYNQLTILQEPIDNLVNLKELYLDHNKLTTLPELIGNLVNLTYLSLGYNQLTALPESISRLVNLKYLYLNNNRLTTLPASILNITKSLQIYVESYEINNLQANTEFLIVSWLDKELTNLPTGLKEIWIKCEKKGLNHKLPFGCKIKYF